MNRIILIGNGFDLAQDLKTSYKDFIDDYWDKKSSKLVEMFRQNMILHMGTVPLKNYEDNDIIVELIANSPILQDNNESGITGFSRFHDLISQLRKAQGISNLKFKNDFLSQITHNQQLQNWVDIEEEYYKALKLCFENKKGIEKLNNDFKDIQIILEEYLTNQVNINRKKSEMIYQKIYYPLASDGSWKNDDRYNNLFFLNFNYTNNIKLNYGIHKSSKLIHIHGELNNPKNSMIFGYGDELDEKYNLIEQLNDNEYLRNIKSIKYLQSRNYQELLAFINSNAYQIFIMGHSCGISDRTLLNKLFEHHNCNSIKPFYYVKDDDTDNYTDITINISRNFKDKSLFRERVVNKLDCEPLTQK